MCIERLLAMSTKSIITPAKAKRYTRSESESIPSFNTGILNKGIVPNAIAEIDASTNPLILLLFKAISLTFCCLGVIIHIIVCLALALSCAHYQ